MIDGLKELIKLMSPVAAVVAAKNGLSQWKVGENAQTGMISNTGNIGFFVKTPEMVLQKSVISSGHQEGELDFSFYNNEALFKKAQEFSKEGTFVRVKYEEYAAIPWFAAGSSRKVTDIEVVAENHGLKK